MNVLDSLILQRCSNIRKLFDFFLAIFQVEVI